jgi:hypothetical protein
MPKIIEADSPTARMEGGTICENGWIIFFATLGSVVSSRRNAQIIKNEAQVLRELSLRNLH